ncbi:MAG: hypothetical protein WD003_02205 [Candidatus Paceibacterota bacterium]
MPLLYSKRNKRILSATLSLLCGFFFGFLFSSHSLFAQIPQQNFIIKFFPQVPAPQEEVFINVESFSVDLNRATLRWFVNGTLFTSGVGVKKITIKVGEVGEETRVSVTATTPEGVVLNEEIRFTPTLVSLLWESNTYTPAFYKGKALLTTDNKIVVTALPWFSVDGVSFLNPQGLVYTWSRNGRVLGSLSGFGKQTLTITGPSLFQEMDLSVAISSFGGSLRGEASLTLSPQEPEIFFYEKHPLRGVLSERALGGEYSFFPDEITLHAEPYFFSQEDVGSNLVFTWLLNGKEITGALGQEITLRKPEEAGRSRIGLKITNRNNFLQEVRRFLSITFGEASRLGN